MPANSMTRAFRSKALGSGLGKGVLYSKSVSVLSATFILLIPAGFGPVRLEYVQGENQANTGHSIKKGEQYMFSGWMGKRRWSAAAGAAWGPASRRRWLRRAHMWW